MDEYCSKMNVPLEENIMASCNRTELWAFVKENQAMNHLVGKITDMIMTGPKSKSFSIIGRVRNLGLIAYSSLRPIPTISRQIFYSIGRYSCPFLDREHAPSRIRELDYDQPIFHPVEKEYCECCFTYR